MDHLIKSFPSRVEGWLDVWEVDQENIPVSEWKYQNGVIPAPNFQHRYCILMENEAFMYIFRNDEEASALALPSHLPRTQLDSGFDSTSYSGNYLFVDPHGSSSDLGKDSTLESNGSHKRGSSGMTPDWSSFDNRPCTLQSLPPPNPASSHQTQSNSGNKILNFFKGGMGNRAKSATKLDRAGSRESRSGKVSGRNPGDLVDNDPPERMSRINNFRFSFNLKRSLSLGRINRGRRPSRDRDNFSPPRIPIDISMSPDSTLDNTCSASSECVSHGHNSAGRVTPSDSICRRNGSGRRLQPRGTTLPPHIYSDPDATPTRKVTTLPPTGCSNHETKLSIKSTSQLSPVHPSLVNGRKHCFSLTTTGSTPNYNNSSTTSSLRTLFFMGHNMTEGQNWIRCLRRTAKPKLENERHKENSLRLCIQEAKNIPPKRRYFCDVCLDRTLYARTTSKPSNNGVFWAEEFDLNNLPDVSMVTLNLYREAESTKDNKKKKNQKKNQNKLIAYVTIQLSDLAKRTETQRWIPMQPANSSGNSAGHGQNQGSQSSTSVSSQTGSKPGKGSSNNGVMTNSSSNNDQVPQIRIKARYQTIDVLPLYLYQPLNRHLSTNYKELLGLLEGYVGVKAKEEISSSLVNIQEKSGTASQFLTELVVQEIVRLDNESLVLRSNTFATKAMECYLKLVGNDYLHEVLNEIVHSLLITNEDFEVDPTRLAQPSNLGKHQASLISHAKALFSKIFHSEVFFPRELRSVFSTLREAVEPSRGSDLCDRLISACLFLRLICPAVLSPCLFGLAQEFPEEDRTSRNLTLLAKTLQALANLSYFEDKEIYMCFLNKDLLHDEMHKMQKFLRAISQLKDDDNSSPTKSSSHDYIDINYELALLHIQLCDAIQALPKDKSCELTNQLLSILTDLDNALNNHMPPIRQGFLDSSDFVVPVSGRSLTRSRPPESLPSFFPPSDSFPNTPNEGDCYHPSTTIDQVFQETSSGRDAVDRLPSDYSSHMPRSKSLTNYGSEWQDPAFDKSKSVTNQNTEAQPLHPERQNQPPSWSDSSSQSTDSTRRFTTTHKNQPCASPSAIRQHQQPRTQTYQASPGISGGRERHQRASRRDRPNLRKNYANEDFDDYEQAVNNDWNRIVALAEHSTALLPPYVKERVEEKRQIYQNFPPITPPGPPDDECAIYDPVAPPTMEELSSNLQYSNPLYVIHNPTSPRDNLLADPHPPPDLASITASIVPPPAQLLPPSSPKSSRTPGSSRTRQPARQRSSSQGRMHSERLIVTADVPVDSDCRQPSRTDSAAQQRPRRRSGSNERGHSRERRPAATGGGGGGGCKTPTMGVAQIHHRSGSNLSKKTSNEYEEEIKELSRQLEVTMSRLNTMEQLLDQQEREKRSLETIVQNTTTGPKELPLSPGSAFSPSYQASSKRQPYVNLGQGRLSPNPPSPRYRQDYPSNFSNSSLSPATSRLHSSSTSTSTSSHGAPVYKSSFQLPCTRFEDRSQIAGVHRPQPFSGAKKPAHQDIADKQLGLDVFERVQSVDGGLKKDQRQFEYRMNDQFSKQHQTRLQELDEADAGLNACLLDNPPAPNNKSLHSGAASLNNYSLSSDAYC